MRKVFQDTDWETEMRNLSSEDSWQMLKQMYSKVVDTHVLKKKPCKKHKPKWMKSSVKKAVKKKYNLYKRCKRTQDYRDYEEYKKQNNRTRQTVRKAQADLYAILHTLIHTCVYQSMQHCP